MDKKSATRRGVVIGLGLLMGILLIPSARRAARELLRQLESEESGSGVDLVGNAVRRVENIASLQALTGLRDGARVSVAGYYSTTASMAPDGGGGSFLYRAASTATPNGGTVVAATAMAAGNFHRVQTDGAMSIRAWGAKGDGLADDAHSVQSFLDSNVDTVDFTGCECRIATMLTVTQAKKRLTGDRHNSVLAYDIAHGRCLEIDADDFTLDGVAVRSANLVAPRSVNKGMVYVRKNHRNISFLNGAFGHLRQSIGDGVGYSLYVEGEAIDNLQITGNAFAAVRAEDEGLDAAEGMCGFIYFEVPNSATTFTRGVSGRIAGNVFHDTESIPTGAVLRSDADAIRFYNGWTAITDLYNTPSKVNSYSIEITANKFSQVQHLCIKASGVGGLHVHHNDVDNDQPDRYPDYPNAAGRNGEKDSQIGFEFRGGSFRAHDNNIVSSAGCIAVNGVIGKLGYKAEVYSNDLTLMAGARKESSCLGLNMDNCSASGNTIRAPDASYARALYIAWRNTYHPDSTVLKGLRIADNDIFAGGAYLSDIADSVVSVEVRDGAVSWKRVNRCSIPKLKATINGIPFINEGAGASVGNKFGEVYLRSKGLTAGTGRRVFDLTAGFDDSTFDSITVVSDTTPAGPGTGNYLFSSVGDGIEVGTLRLQYDGDHGDFYTRYFNIGGGMSISEMVVEVKPVAANLAVPIGIVLNTSSKLLIEKLRSRTVTGNIDNRGADTKIGTLIGPFSVTDTSGGTSTIYQSVPM